MIFSESYGQIASIFEGGYLVFFKARLSMVLLSIDKWTLSQLVSFFGAIILSSANLNIADAIIGVINDFSPFFLQQLLVFIY